MNITGIQMEGKASFVTDEAELGQIFHLMVEKFPFMAELPKNPDLPDIHPRRNLPAAGY